MKWIQENRNIPTVLTREEVAAILTKLAAHPTKWLIASLLYGSGMRLIECLRLRVKDVDFKSLTLIIHDGKGQKDRVVPLPPSLIDHLRFQMKRAHVIWQKDCEEGWSPWYTPTPRSAAVPWGMIKIMNYSQNMTSWGVPVVASYQWWLPVVAATFGFDRDNV